MPKELAKQYAPQGTEDRIYQNWCDKGYFHTQIDRSKKPFTIVMPPPNVTGQLHMGHAMDETWQDILTRYKRMQGYAALWVPGTDHASIATEAKVVAKMREEGLTKEMVGRDGFLERAWDWKNTYGNRIVSQLKKLGCSCDWQRERFGQLVPPLQHLHLRRRGRVRGQGRQLLAPAVQGEGDRRISGAGYHPPRNHAGRYRRGHQRR